MVHLLRAVLGLRLERERARQVFRAARRRRGEVKVLSRLATSLFDNSLCAYGLKSSSQPASSKLW